MILQRTGAACFFGTVQGPFFCRHGVTGATRVVAGSDHTCALVANGEVRCWGANGSRQMGDNTNTNRTTAVAPSGSLSGAVAIGAGREHTCAAFADGLVRCWGTQSDGALGDNTLTFRATPVQTLEIEQTFTSAASAPGVVRGVAVTGRHIDDAATAILRATRPAMRAFHRGSYADVLD